MGKTPQYDLSCQYDAWDILAMIWDQKTADDIRDLGGADDLAAALDRIAAHRQAIETEFEPLREVMDQRERWLAYDAGEGEFRAALAAWRVETGIEYKGSSPMTADDKRGVLKAAGWRRQDYQNFPDRWYHPDGRHTALGVALDTAWRHYIAETAVAATE